MVLDRCVMAGGDAGDMNLLKELPGDVHLELMQAVVEHQRPQSPCARRVHLLRRQILESEDGEGWWSCTWTCHLVLAGDTAVRTKWWS